VRGRGDPECLRPARPSLSGRETASAKRDRPSAAARAPASQAPEARPVRVVGLPSLLSHRAATSPACRPPHGKDASHQSLQPTCCHEYPRSHAIPERWALALLPAAILLVPPSGWEPSLQPEAILGDAGLPLLASPASGRPRSWCCPASCYPIITPVGMRGVPRRSSSEPCRPTPSPMIRPADAPCRCPRPLPGIPGSAAGARTRLPAPQPGMRFFEPEAPSTSKSHRRRPGSRPNGDRMGRHRYPGFAAEGPASDMLSRPNPRSARPEGLPAIRRGPEATCRLPASAMECPPSTPTCRPIPDVDRGKPRPAG
jgi:hypothetical protein